MGPALQNNLSLRTSPAAAVRGDRTDSATARTPRADRAAFLLSQPGRKVRRARRPDLKPSAALPPPRVCAVLVTRRVRRPS